jgi:multicomponent Na+:H+ antiporter subunit E
MQLSVVYRGILPALLLTGLWWLLTDGMPASWVIGIPVVLAAVWATHRLHGVHADRISLTGLLRFAPFFLWESLRGGVDVAARTLAPRIRVRPGFIDYTTRLQGTASRVFFLNCLSLLPGTLAADLNGDRLTVHMLDAEVNPGDGLQRLERAVLRVYPDGE